MEELRRLWGDNIKRGREALALSQADLAELISVTQQSVSAWEQGEAAPRDEIKLRVAVALHQDVRQLFPLVRVTA